MFDYFYTIHLLTVKIYGQKDFTQNHTMSVHLIFCKSIYNYNMDAKIGLCKTLLTVDAILALNSLIENVLNHAIGNLGLVKQVKTNKSINRKALKYNL